ncbi:Malate/L-lactate dehydrogenase [compost metagenome]
MAFLEPSANPVGEGIGHFFGAMRIDGFRPAEDFKNHLDNWIERFKSAKTIDPDKKVIIPGEPEYAFEQERRVQGIPLIDVVVNDLNELAVKLGIRGL